MVAATTTRARYGLGGSLYSDLPRAGTRNLVVGAAMLSIFSAAIGQASEVPSTFRSQATRVANLHDGRETVGCDIRPIGKIIVATLNRAPMVTLAANGHSVTLILDTGAERTVLTPAVAERIGAQRPAIEFQRQIRGLAGNLLSHEVELRSFAVGEVDIPWRRVLVAPVMMAKVFPTPLDGLLGADVLSDFDIDIDLPRHQLTFYQKQICSTAAPDWAGSHTAISTGLSHGQRLFFPVQLDGHRTIAVLDTGSQITAVSTSTARTFGLSEGVLARDRSVTTQGVAGEVLTSHVHRFAKLEVGAAVVHNPEIIVTDLKLTDADMLLGIDFLKSRRVWLSYGSRRLFISSR
jgi:predicted aspartyl protease